MWQTSQDRAVCLPRGDSWSKVLFPVLWDRGRKAHRCKESLQQGQALVKLKLCLCSAWKEVEGVHSLAWIRSQAEVQKGSEMEPSPAVKVSMAPCVHRAGGI